MPEKRENSCKEHNFRTVAMTWLKSQKPRLKDSSIVKYSNILSNYLFPQFETLSIENITRENVEQFINELLLRGGRKKTGLSSTTVTSILFILKNILEYAAQYENCKVVDIGRFSIKQPQKPMRILSRKEQQKLSKYLYENLNLSNLGILLCLYTGIRIGEVCALKWEDISIHEQYLYIHKTMQRIQRKGTKEKDKNKTFILISAPKSECSIRRIPLPSEIFQLIVKEQCSENTYFLTGRDDNFMEPRTMQNHFKTVIRACDIKDTNFHALRHTFATRCVELGFDIKSLSEILGHASVNITLNRYVHPSMELKQKNMNMLSDLLPVK